MAGMFFSLEHTIVQINGHNCGGWADEDDALMMPDVELAQVVRGADGQMLATSTGNRGGQISLKFLANSKSNQFFMEQAVRIKQGAVVNFSGTINNPQSGVSVQLDNGVMVQAPLGQTQGRSAAASREFVFEFETITPNYDGANFNSPPQVVS